MKLHTLFLITLFCSLSHVVAGPLQPLTVVLHDGQEYSGYYMNINKAYILMAFEDQPYLYRIQRDDIRSFSFPGSVTSDSTPTYTTTSNPARSKPQTPKPAPKPKPKVNSAEKERLRTDALNTLRGVSTVFVQQVEQGMPLEAVYQAVSQMYYRDVARISEKDKKHPDNKHYLDSCKAFLEHPYFKL